MPKTPATLSVAMIARTAPQIARPILRVSPRPAVRASLARTPCARGYASSPVPLPKKSDRPWAIASAVIFGSLFVYVTTPSKNQEHGHDDHSKHGKDDHEEEETAEADAEPVELPNGDIEHPEGFVEVKRQEVRHDAPEGDKHIDSRSVSDEHAFEKQSKVKRDPPMPHDNTTFQHGLAHAKDGNPISDPKKVVASAKTAKEEKMKAKAGENVDANANNADNANDDDDNKDDE